jgi:hypothetical protein
MLHNQNYNNSYYNNSFYKDGNNYYLKNFNNPEKQLETLLEQSNDDEILSYSNIQNIIVQNYNDKYKVIWKLDKVLKKLTEKESNESKYLRESNESKYLRESNESKYLRESNESKYLREKINNYLEKLHNIRDEKEDDELAYQIKNLLHQSFAFENNWEKSYYYMTSKPDSKEIIDYDEYCEELKIEKNSKESFKELILLFTKFNNVKDYILKTENKENEPGIENDPGIENESGIENEPGIENESGIENDPGIENDAGIENDSGIENEPDIEMDFR